MEKVFYSHGKLLLTAEYLVLDGAIALAIPTKFGQKMVVKPSETHGILWKSFDADGSVWFESFFSLEELLDKAYSPNKDEGVRDTLLSVFKVIKALNPCFLSEEKGFEIANFLEFPRLWGLGTSSTLIANLSQWQRINPYELLSQTFGGSGYDIACATSASPINYQLIQSVPKICFLEPKIPFSEHIYFVYLNKKQNSRSQIMVYKNQDIPSSSIINRISEITNQVLNAVSLEVFMALWQEHEILLSEVLQIATVQSLYFSDFDGVVKSLGAWGGDFVMVVSKTNPTDYFLENGFETIIPFDEMVLKI